MKNPHAIALGRLGGRAGRGKSKARTTAQARAAGRKGARKRWGKVRMENGVTIRVAPSKSELKSKRAR